MQRARLLSAAAQVAGEQGYVGMSVARITRRARVSRRTFYDLFDDREDCFMAVFSDAVSRAETVTRLAYTNTPGGWREKLRAGLAALLTFFDDEPNLGRLLIIDALAGGPEVLRHRAHVLDNLSLIVARGSSETKTEREPSSLTAEGIVGAVFAVIHTRVLNHDDEPLIRLLNPLMGIIVLPYQGQTIAAKELAHTTTPHPQFPTRKRLDKDPLEDLDMRLTYRTLRVLSTIAAHPEASNRQVADHAGVHDQGQISKLLTRLENLGLIQNTGEGHLKGEPNAWHLTTRGKAVQNATDIHTDGPQP
ncbi:MAG TPA: TetR family transcriptional regulator [Solirubrobacteraceae bacterium]